MSGTAMNNSHLFSRALHGIRWMGLSKVVSQTFAWVVTIQVLRLLQPADYGVVAMAGLVTTLAGLLLDAGLNSAFVRQKDVSVAIYRSANSALVISALVVISAIQIFAGYIAGFFSQPLVEPVLRATSVQFLFGALAIVPSALLIKQMRFKALGVCQALASVGSGALTLVVAFYGAGVWALVVGMVSTSAIRLAAYLVCTKGIAGFSLQLSLLRPYLSFSKHFMAQRIVWYWVDQVDYLIIGRKLGTESLGAYSTARNLSHIPIDRMLEIINHVAPPTFAAVQEDVDRWQSALRKLIRLVSVFSFPIYWGMAAVAPIAFHVLFGEKWNAAVLPFILLCAVLPIRTTHALVGSAMLSLGRADLSFKSVLVWAMVLSPLFLLGAQFGVNGVAFAWVLGFPLVYGLTSWMAIRSMKIHTSSLLLPMLVPAVCAACTALAAWAIGLALQDTVSNILVLSLQIVVGVLTYVLAIRAMSPPVFREVVHFAGELIGRKSS